MEETENLDISLLSATKITSSWPIIRGSFDDTVTYESFISPADSDPTNRKPPLILRRSSPDSPPCEITILFSQQHEIKQVYVRSTARVYEIYYVADERGDNEYLCTVGCGVAARTEELVEETDGSVSLSTSFSGSNRSSCESGGSTNEDGWVDVKVQNPSILGARDSCLTKKDDNCLERGIQECFEATAEISDADPVLSVTLRLLSIQSGDYICIDEIYVFADPVVSADTNSSTVTQEASSESATMSLLIPTLLQMSKFRRNQSQEQRESSVGVRRHQDALHESVSAASISNTSQSESSTKLNGASAPISRPEFPLQKLDSQNNSYFTTEKNNYSRVEKTLDELVSRVAKIEQFCLRFEENMLKPINNMEARLERVEHQLNSFGETAKLSMTACTRFSAPEFTGIDSESNSIFTDGNDSSGTVKSEPVEKGDGCLQDMLVTPLDAYSSSVVQPNDVSSSGTDVAHLYPSLVVTAPDFSTVDDEESGAIEAVKDSPKNSSKKPVSIDEALASALSGFLLSASLDTDNVEETANVSCEESGSTFPSELVQYDDGTNISGKDFAVKEESFGTDNDFTKVTESVEHSLIYEKCGTENPLGNSDSDVINFGLVKTDTSDLSIDVKSREVDDSNQALIFDSLDSPANDPSISALGLPVDNIDSSSGKETTEESSGVLMNIFELQSPVMVDFAIPILDVKFSYPENFSAKSPLDTLLLDVPELSTEVSCVEEDNATSFSEQFDLVMIENVDSSTSETPNDQLLCLDNYDSGCMPLNREEEQPQECSIQDMDASLI